MCEVGRGSGGGWPEKGIRKLLEKDIRKLWGVML